MIDTKTAIRELCESSKEVGKLFDGELALIQVFEEAYDRPDVLTAQKAIQRMRAAIQGVEQG